MDAVCRTCSPQQMCEKKDFCSELDLIRFAFFSLQISRWSPSLLLNLMLSLSVSHFFPPPLCLVPVLLALCKACSFTSPSLHLNPPLPPFLVLCFHSFLLHRFLTVCCQQCRDAFFVNKNELQVRQHSLYCTISVPFFVE